MEKIKYTAEMLEGLVVKYKHENVNNRTFTIQKRKSRTGTWGLYIKANGKIAYSRVLEIQLLSYINDGTYLVVGQHASENSYPIY